MFEVRLTYSHQDLVALNCLAAKLTRPLLKMLFKIMSIGIGVFLCLAGLMMLLVEGIDVFRIFTLLLGLACLGMGLFEHHVNALVSRRLMIKGEGEIRDIFDWDGFCEETQSGTTRRPYSALSQIVHYKNRYFLFLDKRHAYILPEDKFTVGDPQQFKAFIEEKCGKPLQVIR